MSRVGEIRELTSLRAFAAWWVVAYHFSALLPAFGGHDLPVLGTGFVGVDIFFVLSGFVLAYVYSAQIVTDQFNYTQFLINRFARVYPLHLVTMLALLVPAAILYGLGIDIAIVDNLRPKENYDPVFAVFTHLLAVHAWGFDPVTYFNGPSWSISAEFFAYILFPVFGWLFLKPALRTSLALAASLVVGVSLLTYALLGVSPAALPTGYGIGRILPEFVIGMVAWRLWGGVKSPWGWALVAAGVALLLAAPASVLVPVGAACLVLGFATVRFESRVLHFLGEISYSTYMIHALVLFALLPILARFPAYQAGVFVAAIVITLAGSVVSYFLVEVPARSWLRRIANRAPVSSHG